MQQVLKRAVQRGLANFRKRQERDQYKDILTNLFEPDAHNDTMRREAMTLFSLSDIPKITVLNEMYNRSLRIRNLSQSASPPEVNAAPFLIGFFNSLLTELYADSFFKNQISNVLQTRAAVIMPQQLDEVTKTLYKIHDTMKDDYTEEQFRLEMDSYVNYIERTLHNLKIIGVVPKDQNSDPELDGIFVPLRITEVNNTSTAHKQHNDLVSLLGQYHNAVLLGNPGSGKSTAVRHLAWSHAKANQERPKQEGIPLLPNHPLPLRIELRLLMQDRKQHPDFGFLSYATEVILGRENIKVDSRMFEKLLAQHRMLILFDGLDEVTTLDERQRLVQEIEHFAQLYQGNHVLVTSRPVGYDLASCSRHLFSHMQVQDLSLSISLCKWFANVYNIQPQFWRF